MYRKNRNILSISKITFGWSLFVITSAFYMRQVLNFLFNNIGKVGVGIILLILFISVGIYMITTVFKRKLPAYKDLLIILSLICGYLYAYKMRILEEKVHLIKYGILGWLVIGDFLKNKYGMYQAIIMSLVFCLLVVSIDEGIQWFLPWRVGDMRDVGFAVIGGAWGIFLFIMTLPDGKFSKLNQ